MITMYNNKNNMFDDDNNHIIYNDEYKNLIQYLFHYATYSKQQFDLEKNDLFINYRIYKYFTYINKRS